MNVALIVAIWVGAVIVGALGWAVMEAEYWMQGRTSRQEQDPWNS